MSLSVGIPHLEPLTGEGSRADHGARVVQSERGFQIRRPTATSAQKLIDQCAKGDIARWIGDHGRLAAQAIIATWIGIVAESE